MTTFPHRTPGRSHPKYDWTLARRMWDQGARVIEIADRLGCPPNTVSDTKRRLGWPTREDAPVRATRRTLVRASATTEAVTVRCGRCCAVYALESADAPRVCPRGHGEAA